MEFQTKRFDWQVRSDGKWLMIRCDSATEILDQVKADKEYDVRIVEHREKRSLDANAYAWKLLGELSAKLRIPAEDIYRNLIKDVGGNYEVVPIKESAIEHWIKIWSSNGVGWVVDDLGECRNTKGYHNLRCFYGSSVYDKKQMGRLIDLIVAECIGQCVETMTPDQMANILETWHGNDET